VEGITLLGPHDFAFAREFGYAIKLLALARRVADGEIDARVHPALVPQSSPLAEVRGGFNAVLLRSAALGRSLYSGLGAGAMPTGSAVVADLIDICRNILAGVSGRLPMLCPPHLHDVRVRAPGERVGPFYLRFTVSDQPGVLGRIAGVLGEKGISIASVIQRGARRGGEGAEPGGGATVVVFTHDALEADVRAAVAWIDSLSSTRSPTRLIRIEEGPTL